MRRLLLSLLLCLTLSLPAFADNSHGVPDVYRELRATMGDGFSPYIQSGCLPTVPSSSLTFGAFACIGYVRGAASDLVYVTQAAVTLTLANTNGVHWLALHRDTSSTPSGWTRRSGSHYLYRQTASQPSDPSGGLVVLKVTVAGGVITVVTPLGGRNGPVPSLTVTGAYNVKDFGATGDGVTDDTQAIQQALATLPTHGGTLLFPKGTYLVSSTLDFTNKLSRKLLGVGASRANNDVQSVDLVYTASTGSLINADGTRGLEIGGINLAYSHASYTGTLININQTSGSTNAAWIYLHDGRIGGLSTSSGTAAALIALDLCYDVTIERNSLLNAVIAIKGSTVSVVNANAITIKDNLFLQSTSGTAHIQAGGAAWNILHNTFEPVTSAVAGTFDTTSVGVRGLTYHGNWHGDASSGTWVQVTGGALNGASFMGNEMQGTGTSQCLSLGASVGVSIQGNMLECAGNSIDLGTSTAVTVLANKKTNTMVTNLATNGGRSIIDDATRIYFSSGALDTDHAGSGQTAASIRARNPGAGNSLEWGHSNSAGYLATLGNETSSAKPFIALNAEAGTNANTYKTRGVKGRVVLPDLSGGLVLGRVATASADNQSLTTDFTFSTTGQFLITGQAYADLGTPGAGTVTFCTDCTVTGAGDNTCAGAGNGALAVRINGAWRCFNLQN